MKKYLLGYDIGSSSVKASLVSIETGKSVASAFYPDSEAPIKALNPGWAEQEPDDWWTYLKNVTAKVMQMSGAKGNEIEAIGISYQMHGLVCVDKNGKALRPAIIWCDSRAVPYGDKAFREMQSMAEDNDINTMLKRKELSDIIDQCTTLMENLYPFYDAYLKEGVVPDSESMKSLESSVPSTSGESSETTAEEELAVDEELKTLTVKELKYRKTRTKTKIARARNMINFQQETKASEPNPLPEGPLKAKYERKIEILSAYLDKIDYELVARM